MSKGKVLIVEDQSVISTNIEILLKHKDFEIIGTAVTGEEALEIMESKRPDVILMDISLPGKYDGIETTKMIKEKWDIPVVFLTARTDDNTIIRAKQTDAYGYLTKDITLKEQLPILLEFVMYKHQMREERRRAQQEMRDSEEKFRSIASSARDAIIFIDNDGRVSYWNDAASKIFGYSKDDVINKELYELISPETYKEYYKKGFTNYKDNGSGDFIGRTIELEAVTKFDEIIPIELSMSSVKLKGKWCACGIIRDVSLRKATEEELEKLIEEIQISREIIEQNANEQLSLNMKLQESEEILTELNASKDKFFSIIAHDLKGPFQGLLGYSEILSRDIGSLSEDDIVEFATELNLSARHLFKLLENLLDWSRIQRNAIEYKPINITLNEILSTNIDLLQGNAHSKNITLKRESDPEFVILADYNMINTVVRNLLSNAIKFTPKGGLIIVRAEKFDEDFLTISVIDNGIGMTQDDISKIFKIDVHHTTKGTNQEKGTGLGLILCKELTEKNGGKIWVKSEKEVGTTFSFTVPIGRGPAEM